MDHELKIASFCVYLMGILSYVGYLAIHEWSRDGGAVIPRYQFPIDIVFGIICIVAGIHVVSWTEAQYYGVGMGLPLSTSEEPWPLFNLFITFFMIGTLKILWSVIRRLV